MCNIIGTTIIASFLGHLALSGRVGFFGLLVREPFGLTAPDHHRPKHHRPKHHRPKHHFSFLALVGLVALFGLVALRAFGLVAEALKGIHF